MLKIVVIGLFLACWGFAWCVRALDRYLADRRWRKEQARREAERARRKVEYEELLLREAERRRLDRQQRFDAMVETVSERAEAHAAILGRKHLQSVYRDDYGNWRFGKWNKEIAYFLRTVVGDDAVGEFAEEAARIVDDVARGERATIEANLQIGLTNVDLVDATEFEIACANTLRDSGWGATITGRSGDQGCDVMAQKGGFTVVVQCKRYTAPVGNDAVQEAYAAKAHYSAFAACVVSNATFTQSARHLATTTGVLLLHPADLARLGQMIGVDPVE